METAFSAFLLSRDPQSLSIAKRTFQQYCGQIRRQQNAGVLRIYPFPEDNSYSIEINIATLCISWPKFGGETIDSAERFTQALLCALEEVQELLDERGRKHARTGAGAKIDRTPVGEAT
jgi:hypothetical protein